MGLENLSTLDALFRYFCPALSLSLAQSLHSLEHVRPYRIKLEKSFVVIRMNSVKRMKVKMVVMIFECCFPLSFTHKPWKTSYFHCCFPTASSLSGWWCNRCVIFQLLKYFLLSLSVRILNWLFASKIKILLLIIHTHFDPNPYSVFFFF